MIAETILSRGYDSFVEFLAPERDTKSLRLELLSLPGIGQETADCWLNFASTHPAFVVDAYTRRIFERINPAPHLPAEFWTRGTYRQLQEFFEIHLLTDLSYYAEFAFPADLPRSVALLRDYHALIVELGKHHCLKSNPRCRQTGKPGWPDYVHCLSHCLPETCHACPLANVCQFAKENP
jgi:endonuclease-3 related protein